MAANKNEIEQKIKENEDNLAKLKKELAELKKGEKINAIAEINKLIKDYQLTALDLNFSDKGSIKPATIGDKKNKKPAKYQHPETGKTWSGRGRNPLWVKAHLDAGGILDELRIKT
jgi:DNA-binding protein H-NS